MSHLARDLRLALRALVRRPGYAIVAILSLSLGIGANTTIFSLVNAVEFRGLPYRNVDQLVDLHETSVTELCAGCGVGTSYPGFLEWRAGLRAVSGLAGYAEQPVLLAGAESAERVTGAVVSADLFPLLGVAPASGRAIVAADDRAGGEPVVVLSDDLWRRSFGRDTALLGTTVRINGVAHTVVGIMPPRFHFPEFAQLWLPLGPAIDRFPPGNRDLGVIARLKDGATVEQADAELRAIAARQAAEHPATNARWSAEASLYRRALANETGSFFRVLLGAVGFVLLIVCANVANLSLARASGRRREMAIRTALGASRRRLVWQLLVESVMIGLAGGGLGLLIAAWGIDAARAAITTQVPLWIEFGMDWRVLAFSLVVSVATGVLVGLVPALRASRPDLQLDLKDGTAAATAGRPLGRLRASLVVAEVSLALVLLSGAGVMIKTFLRVHRPDMGYDTHGLLVGDVSLLGTRYDDPRQAGVFGMQLAERLAAIPGVRNAAVERSEFIAGFGASDQRITVDGLAETPAAGSPRFASAVSPGYLKTLGLTQLAGRDFDAADAAGGANVVIVNEKVARALWPGAPAVGRRIKLGGPASNRPWLTVIGVVSNVGGSLLAASHEQTRMPYAYVPLAQWPGRGLSIRVRAANGEPMALARDVERAVHELDRDQPLEHVSTMERELAEAVWPVRLYAVFLSSFAAFALVLAAIGIYGVISHSVTQRTHEIGVRVALGASRARVLSMVIGQGAVLAGLGAVLGLAGAVGLTRVLRAMLFGTSPVDPPVLLGVALVLGVVALFATWLPARRAMAIEPMTALRYE